MYRLKVLTAGSCKICKPAYYTLKLLSFFKHIRAWYIYSYVTKTSTNTVTANKLNAGINKINQILRLFDDKSKKLE